MKWNNFVASAVRCVKNVGRAIGSFLKCGFDAFLERAGDTSAFAALSVFVPAFMIGAFCASMNRWYIYFLLVYCVLLLCFMVSVSNRGVSMVADEYAEVEKNDVPAVTEAELVEVQAEA